jgi:DNA-binding response OmpR family regulator
MVLIIEDDAHVRAMLAHALAIEGIAVKVARDGADAFGALSRTPLPDAIILDLGMPNMTGWQFRDLQARHPALAHIPVIVVTGHASVDVDAAAVFHKPFCIDELRAAVRRVLRSAAATPRAPAPDEARPSAPKSDAPDQRRALGSALAQALP